MCVIFCTVSKVNRTVLMKYCLRISLPPSLFSSTFLNPGLILPIPVQLEMPYLVCPNGLIRVLSETPPPFLTPPEVRRSSPSSLLRPSIWSPRGSLQPSLTLPTSPPLLTTLQYLPVLTASQFYSKDRKPG